MRLVQLTVVRVDDTPPSSDDLVWVNPHHVAAVTPVARLSAEEPQIVAGQTMVLVHGLEQHIVVYGTPGGIAADINGALA